MLELESPQWSKLTHAYGPAANIPSLLRLVAENPKGKASYTEEPWFTLWSSLCHQGSIYTASYAAVPHLVGIASRTSGPCAWDFFGLPAIVEATRLRGAGPVMPEFLSAAYSSAVHGLHEAAFRHASHPWDHTFTQAVLAAVAAASGNALLAQAALELEPEAATAFLTAQGAFEPGA
jgi:hypothetical protein